ncbi:hypothetical protein [Pedobacter sp. MR2016-24]|uniref:hypothetical protein n=1 Tax=Pedobacter sp. MR2016-24 TaxID=2994466 RepID=UPI00224758D0|nr:hypothetical protein [Pedobacter sp. MR2016-24]MCX2483140.1 hypothetical protein [Pedobacter sp. MR2016-24]
MESQKKRILIVGGYGMVGSNIARLIRQADQHIELILAGRNPQNGIALAEELNHSETAYINLKEGFELSQFKKIDLIISAVDDRSNILRETAILNGIACIAVSELGDQISPTAFLGLHKTILAPVVYAGHWQAGILTLMVRQQANKFSQIETIELAGLYDPKDSVGPLVANEVSGFVGEALIRKGGNWLSLQAKENPRTIDLHNHSSATGYPLSTLDVPSIAAFTSAKNIRFDFITGESIGTSKGVEASHDLYIIIEGTLLSGEKRKLKTILSGPKGNSHLTAVGVYLITEKILGLNGQSEQQTGGLYLPETMITTDHISNRLEEFGIEIIEETWESL